MENSKTVLTFLLLIALFSCSIIDPLSEDGWVYVKEKDFSKAHAKFLNDYKDFPDSIDITGGLSYTFFVFDQKDSAKHYLDVSNEFDSENNFSIFVSLMYFRDEPESCAREYRKFVSKYSSFPLYAIRDAVKSNSIHKLGLTNEIKRDSFGFVYTVLKRITDISDSLNIESSADQFEMIEYINRLEE